jgi:hypothetical protein
MKKMSVLLAFIGLLFANFVLAQSAVATSVVGTAQVQTGSASPRPLRQGDEVRQGDTVSTGAASSTVLKFDDGQIAALTANSRMTITAYQYNPQSSAGNVLLSLINGGMRAITGLIGRNQPQQVAYRAATATIGIRGTDTTIATDGTNVAVTVASGEVTFTYGGQTITLRAGDSAFGRDGRITPAAAAALFAQLPPALQAVFNNVSGMTEAINNAAPGQPRQGAGEQGGQTGPTGQIGPNTGPGSTGGGSASQR